MDLCSRANQYAAEPERSPDLLEMSEGNCAEVVIRNQSAGPLPPELGVTFTSVLSGKPYAPVVTTCCPA